MTIPEKTTEHHTILKYNLKDEFQIYTMYKLINDDAIVSLQLVELFTNNPLEFFFYIHPIMHQRTYVVSLNLIKNETAINERPNKAKRCNPT